MSHLVANRELGRSCQAHVNIEPSIIKNINYNVVSFYACEDNLLKIDSKCDDGPPNIHKDTNYRQQAPQPWKNCQEITVYIHVVHKYAIPPYQILYECIANIL